jgi:hypothetical protein
MLGLWRRFSHTTQTWVRFAGVLLSLLLIPASSGYAISIIQFAYITLQALPSFISFKSGTKRTWIPQLKPRAIPLSQWALQVFILASTSVLNNWAFAYNVPLPVQILFRSAGESDLGCSQTAKVAEFVNYRARCEHDVRFLLVPS